MIPTIATQLLPYPTGRVVIPPGPTVTGGATAYLDGVIMIGNVAFSAVDISLMLFCPFFAALGVLVSHVLKGRSQKQSSLPTEPVGTRLRLVAGNVFIGLVLGLVVALFFVGAIKADVTSLARVFALSILLGYQAPWLWITQEGLVKRVVKERAEAIAPHEKDSGE